MAVNKANIRAAICEANMAMMRCYEERISRPNHSARISFK